MNFIISYRIHLEEGEYLDCQSRITADDPFKAVIKAHQERAQLYPQAVSSELLSVEEDQIEGKF